MSEKSLFDNSQTLSELFDETLNEYNEIEATCLSTSSNDLQLRITKTISKLEEITNMISHLGLFSSNEEIAELPSDSFKFLLLPYFLGSLTLKKSLPSRSEVIRMALIYFKDFIKRCSGYKIILLPSSFNQNLEETQEESSAISLNERPEMDFNKMAKQREQKIKRYQLLKSLEEKAKSLKDLSKNPSCDEETLREYYLTLIQQYCYVSLNELDSLSFEAKMVKQMANQKSQPAEDSKVIKKNTFKPFLLTKNQAQKSVFGAGYPSLPTMTVEEFYEQRVKEGWFSVGQSKKPSSASQSDSKAELRDSEEEASSDKEITPEELTVLRDKDEWKDTHRRGWGNTYNRS